MCKLSVMKIHHFIIWIWLFFKDKLNVQAFNYEDLC
jgi:desulfoferrodoxin (superoxide reductase-like protein)